MSTTHDVIIIGASLAGSSAAIEAGLAGMRVALVDRKSFPRDKVCGEGLNTQGINKLRELLGYRFATLPQRPFFGFSITRGASHVLLKQELATGIAIPRLALDATLHEQAVSTPDVTCITDPNYSLTREVRMWRVVTNAGNFTAPFLFIADGAHSPTASMLGLAKNYHASGRLGIRGFFEIDGPPLAPYISIALREKAEIYATPLTDTTINLTILAQAPVMRALLRRHLNSAQTLIHALSILGLRGRLLETPRGAGPVGIGRRKQNVPQALLIGDAIESLDPIGGMGMTHALQSGSLASRVLVEHLSGKAAMNSLARTFEKSREEMASPLRGFTALVKHGLPSALALGVVGNSLIQRTFPFVSRAVSAGKRDTFPYRALATLGKCCP